MITFSRTDIGQVREVNQDYAFCQDTVIGNLPNLFIVADGMGGHKAGDIASRYCVENVTESIRQSQRKTPISILEEAIKTANKAVMKKSESKEEYHGMGTTFVAATVIGYSIYIANIGDSRAYLIADTIQQITEDHSLVEAMVKIGDLERKDARMHPRKNIITRALGTNENVIADFFEVPIKEGNILLLCSDGLTNMLEDEEIFNIIKTSEKLETAGERLIQQANLHGGKDNIAVVLVKS